MQMPEFTCSYQGGMNKDISPNEYPNTCYYDAVNLRIITDNTEGLTNGALVTPKGNLSSFSLPSSGLTHMVMLGYTLLRDCIILLAHDIIGIASPDKIYRIPLTQLTTAQDITINNLYYWDDPNNNYLIYQSDLNFNVNNPIKVVGNYENSEVQKIYWVDGLNPLRHLNIINSDVNDLENLDPQLLEIVPNNTYGSYILSETVGGHLKAGRIQYSYQLYSISGTETMFAPPSSLYNLTSSAIPDGIDFLGSEVETEINKSIRISISLPTGTSEIFNRIRLVALEYEVYGDIPTVRVVAEQALAGETIVFNDSGNSIGELILEEFQVVRNSIIPTTIETKNGYLFAANITQEFFDIDELAADYGAGLLDTRAYRWRYIEALGTAYGTQQLTPGTDPIGVDSPYAPASWDCGIIHMSDTAWKITITVGAEAYAAALGQTFVDITSIDDDIELYLYNDLDADWVRTITLAEASIVNFSYGGGQLVVEGIGYIGDKPSDLIPAYSALLYSDSIVLHNTYTYTYSYTIAGPAYYECVLNIGESDVLVVDDGSGVDWNVPEDHSCINVYNRVKSDNNVNYLYKFKEGIIGAPTIDDLGGSGKYISYEFIYHDEKIATRGSLTDGADFNYYFYSVYPNIGYANPQVVIDYTSNQRDEVYRKGIVFYDLAGRPSFTKWIGDIRFPKTNEYLTSISNDDTYELCPPDLVDPTAAMWARALGIKFTIDWAQIEADFPGLLSQLSGFQIVRCPRTDSDITIKAQGIIVPTHEPDTIVATLKNSQYSTYNITSARDYEVLGNNNPPSITDITGTNAIISMTMVELISPELAINKDLSIDTSGDFLEVFGYLENITKDGILYGADDVKSYSVIAATITSYDSTPAHLADHWRKNISDAMVSLPEGPNPTTHIIGTEAFTARGYDDTIEGDLPEMTYKGTSLVAQIAAAFSNVTSGGGAGEEKAMYGRYRKDLGYSIYGGATYQERSYSEYIQSSGFQPIPDPIVATSYDVYGGDVYISPFNFMKLFFDYKSEFSPADFENSGQVLVAFPVESRINLNYRLDNVPKYFSIPQGSDNYLLAEKQSIGISQFPNDYPNIGDLYRYNSAYSTYDISKVFTTKPFDFRSIVVNDIMVVSSEKKYNNEYSDSWLKFKYNNYIELEGEYGAVTRLINNNERLVVFQPRALAILSVLERELVESNNTNTLAVGTGGILSRYDYISKSCGTSLYDAIVPTDLGLYFYDDYNGKIYRILEQLEPISDTKGMKSYYESTPFSSLISAYDRANREVLFTPGTGYAENSVCFSGYTDAFTSFYTFIPEKYITFDKYLLSSTDSNHFYLHNVGNYNRYYEKEDGTPSVDQTSTLTLIVNPSKTNVCTFHIAEWITDITKNGEEITPHITFDGYQIVNTHQDTGVINLNTTPYLNKRFRKWRLNVIRDARDRGRIRDSWIKAIFSWSQQSDNRKLVVHPINFMYLPTKVY